MLARDHGPVGRSLTEEEIERYDHVARSVTERVRLHSVRLLPRGSSGMTLGRHVLLRKGEEERKVLVAHELVHAQQFALRGVTRFLRTYLRDYSSNLTRLKRHKVAYRAIPAESEARELAGRWAQGRADIADGDH
jgi:hypothetical protein